MRCFMKKLHEISEINASQERESDEILGNRKICLAESDRPKQFEDTRESGKKKIGSISKYILKESDEKVIKWPTEEALPQDGVLLKPRDE